LEKHVFLTARGGIRGICRFSILGIPGMLGI